MRIQWPTLRKTECNSSSTTSAQPSLFKKRPFTTEQAAPDQVSSHQQELPDLQTIQDRSARFRQSLSRMKVGGDRPVIQPQLAVGAPGDRYEQEADRVAHQVMSMPDATQQPIQREATPEEEEIQTKPLVASITPLVQREAMPEEEEEVQTKPSGSAAVQLEAMPEQEEELQTKPVGNSIQREALPEQEEEQKVKTMDAGLDKELEKPEPDWQKVAYILNGFSANDMTIRLNQPILKQHIESIYDGAIKAAGVGAKSQIALFTQAVKQSEANSFTEETISFLRDNLKPRPDFVAAIRDFIGLDKFSHCAKRLIDEVTKEAQDNYKKAFTEASKEDKTANTVVTSEKPIPNDQVQKKLDELKILDPLAEIQLRAVMNASADLSSGKVGRPEVVKAAGLGEKMEWCGGFAQKSYGKLDTHKQLINSSTFWSTQKLLNFFTYGNTITGTPNYVWDGKSWLTLKDYHKERRSLRKWIPNSEIASKDSLDIRPGDIVNVWNHGSDVDSGDHIQMVQSWDPTTKTLFTIAGNDSGYKIDNRPPSKVPAAKGEEANNIKKIQDATGFTLTPGSSGGANVGVNFHDLSDEVEVKKPDIRVPYKVENETEEQEKHRKELEEKYKNAVLAQLKKSKKAGKKSFISGIGRPSLVDLEPHNYSSAKIPPKVAPKGV